MMDMDNNLLEKISHENTEFHRLYQEIKILNERKNELPKVVVCGLLKAGKSSLLNVLTRHFSEEYFTTNAARATIKVKSFKTGSVIYIDTPGIDANKQDDIEAWNGLIDADILLFAHNLREGNIVTSEKQFIEELKNKVPSLSRKLIIVFTNSDSVPEEEKKHIFNSLCEEISDIIAVFNKPIIISSKDYKLGMEENEQGLIDISGIPFLQKNIEEIVDSTDFHSERDEHLSSLRENLRNETCNIINKRKEKIQLLTQEREHKFSSLINDLVSIKNTISKRIENFNQI